MRLSSAVLRVLVVCRWHDGFIALDPVSGQVRGSAAQLMSLAGIWQTEASISPLITGTVGLSD